MLGGITFFAKVGSIFSGAMTISPVALTISRTLEGILLAEEYFALRIPIF